MKRQNLSSILDIVRSQPGANLISIVLNTLMNLVIMTFITANFSLSYYGIYVIVNAVRSMFVGLFKPPTGELIFFVGANTYSESFRVVAGLVLDFIFGLAAMVLLFIFMMEFNGFYFGEAQPLSLLMIMAFHGLSLIMRTTTEATLVSNERNHTLLFVGFMEFILKIFLLMISVTLDFGFIEVYFFLVIINSVAAIGLLIFVLLKFVDFKTIGRLGAKKIFEYFYLGRFAYGTSTLGVVITYIDVQLIAVLGSPKDSAIFAILKQFAGLFSIFLRPIASTSQVQIKALALRHDTRGLYDLLSSIQSKVVFGACIYILFSAPLCFLYFTYVGDFSPNLITGVWFILLSLHQLLISLSWWSKPVVTVMDPKFGLRSKLLLSFVSMGLFALAVSLLGKDGVVLAMVTYGMVSFFYWRRFFHERIVRA